MIKSIPILKSRPLPLIILLTFKPTTCTRKDIRCSNSTDKIVRRATSMASSRIDVRLKVPDTRADVRLRYFRSLGLASKISAISLVDSYIVDSKISKTHLKTALPLFQNSLVENATINRVQAPDRFDWVIEIGYLPGVTDNVGTTAKEMLEDFFGKKFQKQDGVYSSQVIFLSGKLSRQDVIRIGEALYNPLIQRVQIKSFKEFHHSRGMGHEAPKVFLTPKRSIDRINLEVSKDELIKIGKEGIQNPDGSRRGPLALDLESMIAIRDYFRSKKRLPTDVELESLAQTWSEHCKHTIFSNPIDDIKNGLYRTYIQGATNLIRKKRGSKDFCVSVFSDNSGAIEFDENYLITHKVETHNSPSALDPFGGSITGIVGVNRDAIGFGLGAKPIANTYGFCFADPRDKSILYRSNDKKGKMLSARRIMEGVIAGVNVGGNCSGIPTPHGFAQFNPRYRGKPLVFVGTVGLIPKTISGKTSHRKKACPGDYIVMVGGRVGQDGIHGATFSSEAMDGKSPASAVQIGDPITQKKLSDAILKEARQLRLYSSITDNGAGGLSCSVAEMAKESNGCLVYLDKVPLKYPGLEPWKIWISESQERMTLAVPKAKWKKFLALMTARDVEATVIGQFTKSGKCIVQNKGQSIMDVELRFLHNGLPKKHLRTSRLVRKKGSAAPESSNLKKVLCELLSRPNIASLEFIARQYDHEVQANSVLKPIQGRGRVMGDAAVIRPVLNSSRGAVLASGVTPSYSEMDPYAMAAASIDSAIRSALCAGVDLNHLGLIDNFCWCSSNEPERLYQLKEAARACHDYAIAYGTPFISGKDSMFNDFKGFDAQGTQIKISAPPTLLISAIGVIKDITKTISMDLKEPGDIVYVLGETKDELGGSEYSDFIASKKQGTLTGGAVPITHATRNKKLYKRLALAIQKRLIASAVSVGRGGLGIAFARTSMAGKRGIDLSLKKLTTKVMNDTAVLFSESQGRIVVSVSRINAKQFERIMSGSVCTKVGEVTDKPQIKIRGIRKVINLSIRDALKAYRSTFKGY